MRRFSFRLSPLMIIVLVLFFCLHGSPASADPPLEDWCCEWQTGDVDQSGAIDITDLSVLIDNMFLTYTPLPCWGEADLDFSYDVDITDLSLFLDYVQFCDGNGPGGSCFLLCPPPPVYGTMLPLTECKLDTAIKAVDTGFASGSCIVWEYDGVSHLTIQHMNAGLNCCPEGEAVITVTGGVIKIDETVVDGLCDCICLFDVDMEVVNLPPGEYTIVVREPYWYEPQETFEFTVDLATSPNGMVCIDRNLSPWGAF